MSLCLIRHGQAYSSAEEGAVTGSCCWVFSGSGRRRLKKLSWNCKRFVPWHLAAEITEERRQRGKLKKKKQTTWSWENQVSKCFCAVGCVFLQCPCLVLCSQSIAKELVASHGESCFHLCMVQPGRSFLWHRVRLKKNKKNAPPPPNLHNAEVVVFYIRLTFCKL